jgi:cytochrome oxidase assembly protein ShyY1
MNQDIVTGPNLLYYVLLVTLLSSIVLTVWQLRRVRKVRVRAWRDRRRSAVVYHYDR